jgi:hypothetical protein
VARGPDPRRWHTQAGRKADDVTDAFDATPPFVPIGTNDRRVRTPDLQELEMVRLDAGAYVGSALITDARRGHGQV